MRLSVCALISPAPSRLLRRIPGYAAGNSQQQRMKEQRASVRHYRHGRQNFMSSSSAGITRAARRARLNIFGERWSVPGSPEIVGVSNVTDDGKPIGVRRAGENWHSDMCYAARPPRGTMLYALEIPDLHGLPLGDTEFASAAAAWDALPEPLRQRIEGRRAVFDFAGRKRAFPPKQSEIDRYPPVTLQ
jgi:alpha-ketoglutarate-dependent taurine dioxygenase